MKSKDFWWTREFLNSQYGESHRIEHEGCILPFKEFDEKLEIGFIGPYSLAYMDNSKLDAATILKTWDKLIQKYPNKNLYIRLPPKQYYNDLYEINLKSIQAFNSQLLYVDVNQHLDLLKAFESRLRRDRVRDLTKAKALGLNFRTVDLVDAFGIIEKNRTSKQIDMSVSIDRLNLLANLIPSRIDSFGISDKDNLVATAIVYTINSKLAYVFMWGHDPEARNGGIAMTSLCKGLFSKYQAEFLTKLCLGTSSVQGNIDIGLMSFKKGLGAVETSREVMLIPKSKS